MIYLIIVILLKLDQIKVEMKESSRTFCFSNLNDRGTQRWKMEDILYNFPSFSLENEISQEHSFD